MSDFVIRDGRGSGSRCKIDPDGRLSAYALSESRAAERAKEGRQFIIPVSVRSITTVDTEYALLRMNPSSATKRFHVHRLFVSVLNSTPVLCRLYKGSAIATANNVTFSPGNANTGSVKAADMTCDIWNTVGTGMTVASNGTEAFAAYFAQGTTDVPIDGSQVWALNAAILVTAECSATNKITATVSGWEEDV